MFTAGTGSMLLTAAAFGAMTFGSDIDGRQLRGKSPLILSLLAPERALTNTLSYRDVH